MSRLRQLVDRLQQGELFQAYLAENYDGIGQYVAISLSRGAITSAFRVKVSAGDVNLGRAFAVGTPVLVYSERGQLRLLNLGGGSGPALAYHPETQYDAAEPIELSVSSISSAESIGSPTLS